MTDRTFFHEDDPRSQPQRVRFGNKLYWATRAMSGNWIVKDDRGFWFRTVNNADYISQFERVAETAQPLPEALPDAGTRGE